MQQKVGLLIFNEPKEFYRRLKEKLDHFPPWFSFKLLAFWKVIAISAAYKPFEKGKEQRSGHEP